MRSFKLSNFLVKHLTDSPIEPIQRIVQSVKNENVLLNADKSFNKTIPSIIILNTQL